MYLDMDDDALATHILADLNRMDVAEYRFIHRRMRLARLAHRTKKGLAHLTIVFVLPIAVFAALIVFARWVQHIGGPDAFGQFLLVAAYLIGVIVGGLIVWMLTGRRKK